MSASTEERVGIDDRGPMTERGRRTKERLVLAALEEFETRGYLETHVGHIVERAGTSHGTFYTYFRSKQEVLQAITHLLASRLLTPDEQSAGPPVTLYDRVARTNRRYFEAYRRNARLMAVIEQVAALDEETRRSRRSVRHAFTERSAAFIERLQVVGAAHEDLDARSVAESLGAMIDRLAYVWMVLGEGRDVDETVHTVTMLWIRAVGADPGFPMARVRAEAPTSAVPER